MAQTIPTFHPTWKKRDVGMVSVTLIQHHYKDNLTWKCYTTLRRNVLLLLFTH